MKKLSFVLIAAGISLFISSCSESCYKCWVESYWNGISYTKSGESYENCPNEGETKEEFEQRIKELKECEDCHTICVKK